MSIELSKEIDYSDKGKVAQHGTYRYSRILQQTGLTTATPVAGNELEVTFEIPSQVFNLSKSILCFDVALPAAGAGLLNFLNLQGNAFLNGVTLQTRTGINLCQITQLWNYMRHTALPTRSFNDYINEDVAGILTLANTVTTTSGTQPTSSSNFAAATNLAQAAANAEMGVRVHMHLNKIPHTILALNKDLYFGQNLLLRFSFAPLERIGSAGAAVNAGALGAAPITNLRLLLAVETNEIIRSQIISQVSTQGLTFKTPYVYSYKVAGGAAYTQTIRLNRGFGSNLLRVYNTSVGADTAAATNITQVVPTTIRTSIDNQYLQDNVLTSAVNEPYTWQRDLFKGSAMMNSVSFANFWTYIDNFTAAKPFEQKDEIVDGIDLSQEKLYSFETTGATGNIYTHVVCQRDVSVGGDQILIN